MGKTKKHEKKSKKKHKSKDKHKTKDKKKHSEKKLKNEKKSSKTKEIVQTQPAAEESLDDFAIPVELMNSKSHAPETPEEYKKRQSQIRREVDPVTGRMRLIKGDSEVLEEIVSKKQHMQINKLATKGDGDYFEEKLNLNKRK